MMIRLCKDGTWTFHFCRRHWKNRRRVDNGIVVFVPISLRSPVSQSYLSASIHFQLHELQRVGSGLSRLEHVNYRADVVSIRASCEAERLEKCFDLSGHIGGINVPFLRLANP